MAEITENKELLLPPKPVAPQPQDCCGTGCCPCVHDIYEQDIKAWKIACDKIRCPSSHQNVQDTNEDILRKDVYTEFEISNIEKVSENTFLYKFAVPNNNTINLKVGQHLILKQIVNGRSLSRQYTPVSPIGVRGYFTVLIKIYPKGKITQVVKNWNTGDKIHWRGPFGTFSYEPNTYNHILMLAAGTGIAPMYQIITSVLASDDDDTRLTLFYSSKTFDDILLRNELLDCTSYWNFKMVHFLSNENSTKSKKYRENIFLRRIQKSDVKNNIIENFKKPQCRALICGTKSFEKDMVNACKDANVLDANIIRF